MSANDQPLQRWLHHFLVDQRAVAGTVHVLDVIDDVLTLRAAVNIPDPVRELSLRIPRGKGMAGLALQRHEPVSTCNLREHANADVRPGAKAVDARAAVALPILTPFGVLAVVGLAYADEREFSQQELARLTALASELPVE